jgi:hypothetical protein
VPFCFVEVPWQCAAPSVREPLETSSLRCGRFKRSRKPSPPCFIDLSPFIGVSESTVGRIWKQNGLKPHLVVGFKVSDAPRFEDDRTGYFERAIVNSFKQPMIG